MSGKIWGMQEKEPVLLLGNTLQAGRILLDGQVANGGTLT
jgi:hypothetical protein